VKLLLKLFTCLISDIFAALKKIVIMYAIVEIAGLQYKVEQDQQIYVHRLEGNEGDKLSFDRVMLTEDNGNVVVGAPVIEGVAIDATIIKHLKGDKVWVFKKKRRKGYQKLNGHRQSLTQIVINGIGAAKAAKKAEKKVEPKKVTETAAVVSDDLQRIEGVGPKAAQALVKGGIDTFAKLAASNADSVKEVLTAASKTLASLDPTTWMEQADLAANGKWDELKELQDKLQGGRPE